MDKLEQGLDLLTRGIDDARATIELQFGVSTGAIAFFVHAMFERGEGPLLVGILSLATVCFGVSAITCLNALADLVTVKTGFANMIVGTTDSERTSSFEEMKMRMSKTRKGYELGVKFFYAGVVFSAALIISKFVMEVAAKFSRLVR